MLIRRTNHSRFVMLTACSAVLAATSGCSSREKSPFESQWSEMRSDPTSQLDSTSMTHYEFKNRRTTTADANLRAVIDDWDRFWLLDRPSRLTIYPPSR